jgi:hypothetical protein
VFVADHAISPESNNNFKQRIYIYNNAFTTSQLRNVVVLANFDTSNTTINPNFPTDVYTYPMTWYDLMNNNTPVTINNPSDLITVASGRFRVFGNRPSTLSSEDFNTFSPDVMLYPNPVKNSFAINQDATSVDIYTLTGQLVSTYTSVAADQAILIDQLQSGIYLVKIKTATGSIQTKKISKE